MFLTVNIVKVRFQITRTKYAFLMLKYLKETLQNAKSYKVPDGCQKHFPIYLTLCKDKQVWKYNLFAKKALHIIKTK